jgi:L-seryl-tRNA(Ser) seleniumtransferase
VSVEELVGLKKKHGVLVIDDLGCGSLYDLEQFGLPHEPTVQESVQAGSDLVCFSGDKLLGGAQAGIIVGREDLVAAIRKHPLTRILRVCKITDTVLEHSLRLFFDPETLPQKHPTIRMLAIPLSEVRDRASRLVERIREARLTVEAAVRQGASAVGGGSMPAVPIQTAVVALRSPTVDAERLSYLLRQNEPPVVTRISEQEVLVDVRTLLDGEDDTVFEALRRIAPAA